jgi:hypothetical protein
VIVAYSIASKRYAIATQLSVGIYRLAEDAAGQKKRSEHGLGHLRPPAAAWEDQLWEHLINTDTGRHWPEAQWFDQPALGRLTVNTTHDWKLLRHINDGRDYHNQIRPGGFLTIAHAHPIEEVGLIVAPFTTHPDEAKYRTDWFDRSQPTRTGLSVRTTHPETRVEGSVVVLDYRTYVEQYRGHAEACAIAVNGTLCTPATYGILGSLRLREAKLVNVGKESNGLEAWGVTLLAEDAEHHFHFRVRCRKCAKPLEGRQAEWCSERCRVAHRRDKAAGHIP